MTWIRKISIKNKLKTESNIVIVRGDTDQGQEG
jgi:hypothetical protein